MALFSSTRTQSKVGLPRSHWYRLQIVKRTRDHSQNWAMKQQVDKLLYCALRSCYRSGINLGDLRRSARSLSLRAFSL